MQRNTGKPQIRSQCILKYKGMAPARARSCPRGLQSLLEGCPMATRIVGECLPGARPARYLSINYPDFSPRFTL